MIRKRQTLLWSLITMVALSYGQVPQSPVQKFPHSLKAKTTITAKGSPISSTVRGARRNWRKSRSPNRTRGNDLPEPTIVLTDKRRNCTVYLVGTLHYSWQSREDVATVINIALPDAVFLELFRSRYKRWTKVYTIDNVPRWFLWLMRKLLKWTPQEAVDWWRRQHEPSANEFTTAIRLAKRKGAKLTYGDQAVFITELCLLAYSYFRVKWAIFRILCGPKSILKDIQALKITFFGSPSCSENRRASINKLKVLTRAKYIQYWRSLGAYILPAFDYMVSDQNRVIDKLFVKGSERLALKVARYGLSALLFLSFVTVTQGPLLLERDPILAENLLKVCKEVGGGKVVAVLGMAHLNGVAERLKAKGFQ